MPRKKTVNKDLLDLAKHIDSDVFLESVKNGFSGLKDPRVKGQVKYPTWLLLFVIISGFLAGCNDIQDLVYFTESVNILKSVKMKIHLLLIFIHWSNP